MCLKEKLRFLFYMYDLDGDGVIILEEYRNVVEELFLGNFDMDKVFSGFIVDEVMMEVVSIRMR